MTTKCKRNSKYRKKSYNDSVFAMAQELKKIQARKVQ